MSRARELLTSSLSRGARAWATLMHWARSVPFTMVVVTVAAVAGLARLALGPHARHSLDAIVSSGFDSVVVQHHWAGALSSIIFAHDPLQLIVIAALLGGAERLLGTRRTIVVYLSVAILGTLLGLGIQAIGIQTGDIWSHTVRSHGVVDALLPVYGTLMAASAFAHPILRRRIRVLGFAGLTMFVLYSGQPSDLYRVFAAMVGLGIGMLLARPSTPIRRIPTPNHEYRSLLAAIVAITAVGPLITLVSPVSFGPLKPLGLLLKSAIDDGTAVALDCDFGDVSRRCIEASILDRIDGIGPVLLTLLPLVALLVAAVGILRGRRIGLWLASSINLLLAVLAVLYYEVFPRITTAQYFFQPGGRINERDVALIFAILVPVATAALLIASRRYFPTDFQGGGTARFAASVGVAFLALSGIYLALSWLVRDQFEPTATFAGLLVDLPERFIPVGYLSFERISYEPQGVAALVAYLWVGPVFWAVVVTLAAASIRRGRVVDTSDDRARLMRLLHEGAGGSMSWMTTWSGHRYWFSASGDAAVAYRVISGIALATGEPVGAEHGRAQALSDFAAFCTDHGWTPVFYSAGAELQSEFDRLGWSLLEIAEEAIIAPAQWSVQGKSMQDIRTAGNRAERAGLRAEWTRFVDLDDDRVEQIRAISSGWVSGKELPELGFTLGGFDELADESVALMLAIDDSGQVDAVTSWLPTFENGAVVGWTLDVMRRRPDSMPGIMEFVIAQCVLRAREEGIRFVSLSGAPLARSSEEGDPLASRVLAILGRALEPSYGFGSLLRFKKKFRPELRPLYLAYPDPLALPAVGVAVARAYAPGLSTGQALSLLR
jgi:lysylphosphatidylglycerol synthetase-like protein (DUF2156 family)